MNTDDENLNIVHIPDHVDAAAATLMRFRQAAEVRGQGRIYGAAAKASLRHFGAAMEAVRASPVREREEQADPRQMGGYSGAGVSRRDPQIMGAVLDKFLASRGWRTPVNVWSVMEQWPHIVGESVAQNTVPEVFEDTVLTVRCSSTVYASHLKIIESDVLQKVTDHLGPGIVTRLLIQGPVAPSWKHGPRTVRGRGPRDTYG